MAFPDATVHRIRKVLSVTFGSQHKIIIVPCAVDVYSTKTRDFLKKSSDVKWALVGSGVMAVVHNSKGNRDRLQLCLSSPKTAEIIWQETVVPYTILYSPHDTFHTLSSTRNYQERAGVLYQDKAVARLVFQVLSMFTSQGSITADKSSRNPVGRSHSFCVAPRPKAHVSGEMNNAFERYTLAMSKVQVQQVFSTEGQPGGGRVGPMMATMCSVNKGPAMITNKADIRIRTQAENMRHNRPSLQERANETDSLLTTDLCTTDL